MRDTLEQSPSWFPRVAGLLVMSLFLTYPALAHEKLKRSTPADGARVSMLREIRLTFTEPPELTFTKIRLLDSAERELPLSPIRLVPDTAGQVVADLAGDLSPGLYTVAWQVAGRDGHPTRGRFTFTVMAPNDTAPSESAGGQPPPTRPPASPDHDVAPGAFDAESSAFVVVRSLTFMAFLTIIGVVAFRFLVLGSMRRSKGLIRIDFITEAERRAASIGVAGGVLLLVMSVFRLYAQSYAVHGGEDAANVPLILAMIGETVWGWGWIIQAVTAVSLIVLLSLARGGLRRAWTLGLLASIAAAVSPALSGHAASVPRLSGLTILGDSIHVLGAGGWLGTLLILVGAGIPASRVVAGEERHAAIARLVNAYSPVALASAGVTALTGLFAAWIHVSAVPNLWRTPYGVTLLIKTVVLTGVAATGAYNWRFVRPRLGDAGGTSRIARSARLELLIALIVIVVTAVLVAEPTPSTQDAMGYRHSPIPPAVGANFPTGPQ
jgi:putative copper export protein/methionine-rich copper-binding protein CopC